MQRRGEDAMFVRTWVRASVLAGSTAVCLRMRELR